MDETAGPYPPLVLDAPVLIAPTPKPKKGAAKSKTSATPATIPKVHHDEQGAECITFAYSVKGVQTEYTIITDVNSIDVDTIPDDFKTANCVYPRANCLKTEYTGNRWEYEKNVNVIGWKLCWKNPESLCRKRGLIQRAVDSYRNRFPELRSRRVVRQEKLVNGTLRKRADRSSDFDQNELGEYSSRVLNPDIAMIPALFKQPPLKKKKIEIPSTLIFETILNSNAEKHRIRVDIETVDIAELPNEFKSNNVVFPRVYNVPKLDYTFGPPARWEFESSMNDLGWKLAWLNAARLSGRKALLQRAMDSYRALYMEIDGWKPRPGKRVLFVDRTDAAMNPDDVSAANGLLAVLGTRDSSDDEARTAKPEDEDDAKVKNSQDAAAAALLANFSKG